MCGTQSYRKSNVHNISLLLYCASPIGQHWKTRPDGRYCTICDVLFTGSLCGLVFRTSTCCAQNTAAAAIVGCRNRTSFECRWWEIGTPYRNTTPYFAICDRFSARYRLFSTDRSSCCRVCRTHPVDTTHSSNIRRPAPCCFKASAKHFRDRPRRCVAWHNTGIIVPRPDCRVLSLLVGMQPNRASNEYLPILIDGGIASAIIPPLQISRFSRDALYMNIILRFYF